MSDPKDPKTWDSVDVAMHGLGVLPTVEVGPPPSPAELHAERDELLVRVLRQRLERARVDMLECKKLLYELELLKQLNVLVRFNCEMRVTEARHLVERVQKVLAVAL